MKRFDEKFLERVFDSVTDPFAIYDSDFRIIRTNKALRSLFGFNAEKIAGRNCFEIFYHRTEKCDDCHVSEVFRTGEPRMIEKQISIPGMNERVFEVHSYPIKDDNGITVQAAEHVRDITERKNLENKLHASVTFNNQVINSITDSLIVIDPKTRIILQANEAFHARVGMEPPTAIGKRCHEIVLNTTEPCGESGIRCPMEETMRSIKPARSDKVYPDAGGEDRMLEISTYPILDAQGQMTSIIRLERDVTEKRKMEDALEFRSKELQRTQHQLETLFEISRLVSTKNSLLELVDFILDMGQKMFPGSEILLFFIDAENHNFLDLESGNPAMAELCLNVRQTLDQSGLLLDFIRHLKNIRDPHIASGDNINDIPPLQEFIAKRYVKWFGLPICTPQQCIGYAVLGSPVSMAYSREDLHFFQGFFSLIAGHIRHLVMHESEIGLLRQKIEERTNDGKIIGQSDEMQKLFKMIDLVSGSDATVLITGENGTGKEMVAQAIHRQSHRKNGPFIVANCSAYSSTLLESELFGHEKGAFTGAIKRKQGRIERAQGGTLFLDEIGNISPATQVLMLRFLQDRCFERVGGEETIETDVRVLAATNLDLYKEMEAGRFRDDLFYRLNVISIHLPRLLERKEDIPLLCRHFLKKYGPKEGKTNLSFSPDAMQILMDYDWPGNVRQLENAVSHAVILAQGHYIETMHLPQSIHPSATATPSTSISENERLLILRVLQESDWNKHEAAQRLEVSRSTLYSKIKRYGLKKD